VGLPANTKLDGPSTKPTCDAYPIWLLFDESSTCIAELDLELRVVGGNAGFAHAFGLDVGALQGCEIAGLVHSSVRDKLSWQLRSLAFGDSSRFTDRVGTVSGCGTANLEITGISVTNDTGGVESLIVLVQPERIAAERRESVQLHPAKAGKPLTKMDAGVLEGVASGMSTVKLAANLFLSRSGVEYHVNALMKKLKAGNRSELVSKAYAAGLFSTDMWPPRVISDFVE
jgi:DNA-binding CsgD family transcriptional regulator